MTPPKVLPFRARTLVLPPREQNLAGIAAAFVRTPEWDRKLMDEFYAAHPWLTTDEEEAK
jgi:hypothetical protein